MNIKKIIIMVSIVLFISAGTTFAQQITKPNTFIQGQTASAAEVNENFDVVYEKVNDLDANAVKKPAGPATGDLLTYDGNHWIAQQPAVQRFTINNMQPYLTINFIIALQGIFPSRSGIEPFIGEICMFAGNFAPRGWALCDGQLLPIAQNTALFSLLGTTYGGDGRTIFALPDLRGRVPIHAGTGPGLTRRQLGEKGGEETTGR